MELSEERLKGLGLTVGEAVMFKKKVTALAS